ncbi:MAG TPA: caspase family protein [Chitinophagaceae bacterium]|nr:caspase family protein [Chitinophagaceae bacterium]
MNYTPILLAAFFLLFTARCISQQPRMVWPVGHTGYIMDSKFSTDDKLILTTSMDKTVKIWDRASGKELFTLTGHTDNVLAVDISKDGKYISTCSSDNTARIYETNSARQVRLFKHTDDVTASRISSDNKQLLTSSSDKSVCLWNIADGKKIFSFDQHKGGVKSAFFSPDEKNILSYDYDQVYVFTRTGKKLFSYYPKLKSYDKGGYYGIGMVSYSPDGELIMVICQDDYTIRLVDAHTGEEKKNIVAHPGSLQSASFNESGSAIITTDGSDIKVWDTRSGTTQLVINKSGQIFFNDARFTRDGKQIIANRHKTIFFFNSINGQIETKLDMEGRTGAFSHQSGQILIFPEGYYTTLIWDISRKKITQWLKGYTQFISTARFNSSGDKIVIAGRETPSRIIDLANCRNIISIYTPEGTASASFSPDGSSILTYGYDSTMRLWSIQTGKELKSYVGEQRDISYGEFHPDGKMILSFEPHIINYGNHTARVWETASGKPLFSLQEKYGPDMFSAARYSPDGNYIITSSGKNVKFWDARTFKQVKVLNTDASTSALSPDGKYIAVEKMNDVIELRDPVSAKLLNTFKGHLGSITDIQFSPDSKWLATASFDSTVRIWDIKKGTLLSTLKGHQNWVENLAFNPGSNRVLTASWDNTIRLWNPLNGKLLTTVLMIDSVDMISITPAGYYQSTPGAAKRLHYVTKDLKVITFEQLDVKFNRPDKVQEAIGNSDTSLIKSYRNAWNKRIKKLGIDTTLFRAGFAVPDFDIANRESIDYEQKNETLSIHLKGNDKTYGLDRFNIWVNESPVFGQRGIVIRNTNSFDTTILVELSQGENRIETSITNVNGTESYRMPLLVNYSPAVKQKESVRFVGIGIEKFKDVNYNLNYSVKDIRDLAARFKLKYGNAITIDTLFDEKVTPANVKALKQQLLQTNENDKVIVAYSGHGILSKDFDYYLSTYSVNFEKPEENGLPYDELENLLDSIPARKKLMLIDACHSGEVDKEELVRIDAASQSLQLTKGTKPVALRSNETHLGIRNSFELMQSLFVNVSKSTGATIISAAAGTQFALERGDLKNGVFTYCLLEAMNKNPAMKISELKKIVGERVEQLTNGLQKPTSRNEMIAVDWTL